MFDLKNSFLPTNAKLISVFIISALLVTSCLVSAEDATLDSVFNNPFLVMQVKQKLIPGMDVTSISMDPAELEVAEQAIKAGIEDSRTTLVGNIEKSSLPTNTKAFLSDQARTFDLFHWLGSKCVIDANVCDGQKFTMNIKTKGGGGFEATEIKCDTSVEYREPKNRLFRSDVVGDVILTIDDCYFYAVPGNKYSKTSLSVMSRSGYTGEPIKVSMNEQVQFLNQVEAYNSAVNSTASATGVSGNAEVMGEFYNEALTTTPDAPTEAVQEALNMGVIKRPSDVKPKTVAKAPAKLPSPAKFKTKKLNDDAGSAFQIKKIKRFDPNQTSTQTAQGMIPARYCTVEKQGMTFECVLPKPTQKANMDCRCSQSGTQIGKTRI